MKPRVLPFFCEPCRMGFRSFTVAKEHVCDKEAVRKAVRKEEMRKFSDYDCSNEMRLALNAEKQWRFNALAVMEQSLRPDMIMPKKVEMAEVPTETEHVESEPEPEFYEAKEKEYEDDVQHFKIHEVLIESTQPTRPESKLRTSKCIEHKEPGVFCFNCKGTFESYSQYDLHLSEDFNEGKCSKALPDYYYIQNEDRTGMFDKRYKHSVMHIMPVKRDVRHIQCTLCKAVNFATSGDLYSHMVKCASSTNHDDKESPMDCQTAFGYGMPPSFNACQYVFPDPAKGIPRRRSDSDESIETEC
ncbi:hypothetical protein CRE_26102 [Caenorhabditis remanei]|uniref:Uncharacterized protein n=1 Tax=Caenorhabditis remanei TaxID=31234 RepID=E3LRQ8_CAERE|nr:hypothetical protein CRE_26102 [Caenorhabditis remanei]